MTSSSSSVRAGSGGRAVIRRQPSGRPSFSVVVPSHNEGEQLRATVHHLLGTLPPDAEIVVVDDASTDGSADPLRRGYASVRLIRSTRRIGAVAARNRGAAAARGEILVFADAHVQPRAGWPARFATALAERRTGAVSGAVSVLGRPDARGYGFTWNGPDLGVTWLGRAAEQPYPVPLLPGAFLAIRRDTFERVGGFDGGLVMWGCEDAELSLRLWLLGFDCVVDPAVEVAHLFRDRFAYPMDWSTVLHNTLRVGVVHFAVERLERFVAVHRSSPGFPAAFARLADSDAWTRRHRLQSERVRDDGWFFDHFAIPFESPKGAA